MQLPLDLSAPFPCKPCQGDTGRAGHWVVLKQQTEADPEPRRCVRAYVESIRVCPRNWGCWVRRAAPAAPAGVRRLDLVPPQQENTRDCSQATADSDRSSAPVNSFLSHSRCFPDFLQ